MESTKLEKTISIKSALKKLVAEVHKCTERQKELEEQIEEKRNKAKDYADNGEIKKCMFELKLKKQLTIDLETIINLFVSKRDFVNKLDIRISENLNFLRASEFFHGLASDGRILINCVSPYQCCAVHHHHR